MTLERALQEKLAEWRPDNLPALLETEDEGSGWRLRLTAEQVDGLGVRLTEVTLSRLSPLADAGDLKLRAEALAARVGALGDPLRLVEADGVKQTALLRSATPRTRDRDVLYFELLAGADGAVTVHRYQGSHQPGCRRQRISFALTHEALVQLTGELTDA